MSKRKIFFLTATRADYDLLYPVIKRISSTQGMEAEIIVSAAQLSPFHGFGVKLVEEDNIKIAGCIESLLCSESWQGRSLSFSHLVEGLTHLLTTKRPDILFVTGDREEALAGALVGNFLRIPVAHSYGGDRCYASDIDEVFRPAISKLVHLHFTATEGHRQRLIQMGERPELIWNSGATGLDVLREEPDLSDAVLTQEFGVDVRQPFFMLIHHPSSTINPQESGLEMSVILDGILSLGVPVFCSYPNYDPGNIAIRDTIDTFKTKYKNLIVYHNLPRRQFVSLYRRCAAIVGNSSSIVIESGYLKVAGILIGPRQNLRETGPNVLRINISTKEIQDACNRVLSDKDFKNQVKNCPSLYGDGHAAQRICDILSKIVLNAELLRKTMTY